MKEVLTKAISNPISSAILIGTIATGIIGIVRAIKGIPPSPALQIDIGKNKSA